MRYDTECVRRAEEAATRVTPETNPIAAVRRRRHERRVAETVRRSGVVTPGFAALLAAEVNVGDSDLVDDTFFELGMRAAQSVCRLSFERGGRRNTATGFLVSS